MNSFYARSLVRSPGEISMFLKVCLSVLGLFVANSASADWSFSLPSGVAALSSETYDLHAKIMYACCLVGVFVFAAMIFALIKHRRSQSSLPATCPHGMATEMFWTAIPILILLVMVLPSAEAVIKRDTTLGSSMTSNTLEHECPRWSSTAATPLVSTASQQAAKPKGTPVKAIC
jgi:heme/copper-type cytochrome/quinol oxidase subunit 2